VATESRNYTVPVLVHLLGIALGAYLGYLAMSAIAPDLPDPDTEPGVSSSVAPAAVAGSDPDSLFLASNLAPALDELEPQLTAGEGLASLHITPGSIDTELNSDVIDGLFDPGDVPADVPERLATAINEKRGGVSLDDVAYMDLVATAKGPRWYVQLDTARDVGPPPWTYGAPLAGAPLVEGPGPPEPVG